MIQFILTEWKLGKTRYTNQRGATIESKKFSKIQKFLIKDLKEFPSYVESFDAIVWKLGKTR